MEKIAWTAFLERDHSGWVVGPLGTGITEYKSDPSHGKFSSYDEAYAKAKELNIALGFSSEKDAADFLMTHRPCQSSK